MLTWVFLLVTLLIFNVSLLFLFVRVKVSQEQGLGEKLALKAEQIAADFQRLLAERDLEVAYLDDLRFFAGRDWPEMVRQLETSREGSDLERVILHDADGRVVIDSAGEWQTGDENPQLLIDSPWVSAARSGEAVATLNYRVANTPLMRAYAPLTDDTGRVRGVLSVEGQRTYFVPLQRLRRLMVTLSLLVSGTLIGLALWARRALTRFVRLEAALAHSDRLQTLGTLAAGVAHEIRNPLSTVRINTEALRSSLNGADSDAREMCDDMLEEIDRIQSLLENMLGFARPGDERSTEPAALSEEIARTTRLFTKAAAASRVEIAADVDPALTGARTPLPAASLQQVLFNLLRNALDAMDEMGRGGAVRLSAVASADGQAALVSVRDAGVGMTPEQMRAAGHPFRTTKEEGTGLGLSITRNLLASVQGHLEIASTPGEGTTVTATLPLVRQRAEISHEERSDR